MVSESKFLKKWFETIALIVFVSAFVSITLYYNIHWSGALSLTVLIFGIPLYLIRKEVMMDPPRSP